MLRTSAKIVVIFFYSSVFMALAGCGYLIQPTLTQSIFQLEKGSYQLDKAHATVLFKINHLGLSTYVGRFNRVEASLEFDPNNLAAAKLSAAIDIASLDINNASLTETLLSGSWFDVQHYPQAFFKTTSVRLLDESNAEFSGNLSLHGVTAPIVLRIHFNGAGNNLLSGAYTLGFSARGSLQRSVFGMDNLIPALADQVDLEVFAEFQQQ